MKTWICAALLASTVALPVSAATYGSIPDGATNEVLGPLGLSNPLGGWYGANLYLIGGPATIKVTILGYEAGNLNTFSFGTDSYTSPGGMATNVAGLDTWNVVAPSGLLNFSFSTSGGGSVANGANPDNTDPVPTPGVNFFTSFVHDPAASAGQGVYLFFDDDGASNDDNHDDLVVLLQVIGPGPRITPDPVPLPAAGVLLVGALGGLAAIRRRMK